MLLRAAPLLFVFLWSTGFIGAKFGLPYADALSFLLARYVLVIGLMTLLAMATRAPWPNTPERWFHIGISGILLHGFYLSGVFIAIERGLPAGITALIVGMQPLLTAVGAGALLGEKVSPRQWGGLGLGLLGVFLVVSSKITGAIVGDGSSADAASLGPMLIPALLALLGITSGTLYQKKFCPSFDLRTGAVVQFLPTLALTALAIALFGEFRIEWTPPFIFALGWLVLVLSLGAISLLNVLIRSGSAVNVARLFYLTPPSTAIIAWLLFGETLTGIALIGMGLAVAGVWLAKK